jgi:hypothetical protein
VFWWHYPVAITLPFPIVVLAAPAVLLRELLGLPDTISVLGLLARAGVPFCRNGLAAVVPWFEMKG